MKVIISIFLTLIVICALSSSLRTTEFMENNNIPIYCNPSSNYGDDKNNAFCPDVSGKQGASCPSLLPKDKKWVGLTKKEAEEYLKTDKTTNPHNCKMIDTPKEGDHWDTWCGDLYNENNKNNKGEFVSKVVTDNREVSGAMLVFPNDEKGKTCSRLRCDCPANIENLTSNKDEHCPPQSKLKPGSPCYKLYWKRYSNRR